MVVMETVICILQCVMKQDRASTGASPLPGIGVSTLPRNLSILSSNFVDFRALTANSASRFDQQIGGYVGLVAKRILSQYSRRGDSKGSLMFAARCHTVAHGCRTFSISVFLPHKIKDLHAIPILMLFQTLLLAGSLLKTDTGRARRHGHRLRRRRVTLTLLPTSAAAPPF